MTFECNDNRTRYFDINRMYEEDVPQGWSDTFKNMFKSNDFEKAYVLYGDLVWPGWCEILAKDIEKYTHVIGE